MGYMTARDALANGFTHHGKYFGIPCWIGGLDATDGGLRVAAKWAPLEAVMTLFHHIECALRSVMFPDEQPVFQFLIGKPIAKEKGHA
jgi:hypothetical protein